MVVVGPDAMYAREGNNETFDYRKKRSFGITQNVKVEIAKGVQFIFHGYESLLCARCSQTVDHNSLSCDTPEVSREPV